MSTTIPTFAAWLKDDSALSAGPPDFNEIRN